MKKFTVDDIREFNYPDTWKTKAGAELQVLLALDFGILKEKFLDYDAEELKKIPADFDIRGLRSYTVRKMAMEKLGGTEFHRIRWEVILGLDGEFKWTSEDLDGRIKTSVIKPGTGIILPPFILHRFESMVENSGLLVICNTLFDPSRKDTQDSYSEEEFKNLQKSL